MQPATSLRVPFGDAEGARERRFVLKFVARRRHRRHLLFHESRHVPLAALKNNTPFVVYRGKRILALRPTFGKEAEYQRSRIAARVTQLRLRSGGQSECEDREEQRGMYNNYCEAKERPRAYLNSIPAKGSEPKHSRERATHRWPQS